MENQYLLSMNNISKQYSGNRVLKNVNLQVKPGEIISDEEKPHREIYPFEYGPFGLGEVHPLLGDYQPHRYDGKEDEKKIVRSYGFFPVFYPEHEFTLSINLKADFGERGSGIPRLLLKRIYQDSSGNNWLSGKILQKVVRKSGKFSAEDI